MLTQFSLANIDGICRLRDVYEEVLDGTRLCQHLRLMMSYRSTYLMLPYLPSACLYRGLAACLIDGDDLDRLAKKQGVQPRQS